MGKNYRYDEKYISLPVKIFFILREYSSYFTLAFIGTLIWILSYLLLFFYKEILYCYLRSSENTNEGKSHLYKFIEYKPHFKNLFVFNIAILIYWFAIIFLMDEWKKYMLNVGFFFFFLIYILYWGINYKYYNYNNDFWDQTIWLYNYFKNYIKKNIKRPKSNGDKEKNE